MELMLNYISNNRNAVVTYAIAVIAMPLVVRTIQTGYVMAIIRGYTIYENINNKLKAFVN